MEGPGIDDRTPGLELIFDLEALESNARTLASIYSIEPQLYIAMRYTMIPVSGGINALFRKPVLRIFAIVLPNIRNAWARA